MPGTIFLKNMYRVKKQIHFCYGHRLMKHKGKCFRYHGHNAVAEIICEAKELNANDMVIDFGEVSSKLKSWIDNNLDHRMILCEKDPMINFLKESNEPFFEVPKDPTVEVIAQLIFDEAKKQSLPVVEVNVWETPTASASFS